MDVQELLHTAGTDPLVVFRAVEVVKSFADARQLDAIVQMSQEDPAVLDAQGRLCDPVPAGIACALGWTPAAALPAGGHTDTLCHCLPGVLAALRCGRVDLDKAREIALGTCELDPAGRVGLAEAARDYAAGHTVRQLRGWLARQVALIDSEAVARRPKARKARRVWVQPESDGMATGGAYLTAEQAQACLASLKAAAGNHAGSVEPARADLLVEPITGIPPGTPVPVQVIITADRPELARNGPISQEHATRLHPQHTE